MPLHGLQLYVISIDSRLPCVHEAGIIYIVFIGLYWRSTSLCCLVYHTVKQQEMTCIWNGNDLEGKGRRGINYFPLKKSLNEGAAGAKGAAYSTNSCQTHNELCWKANLILQPERLPCINELPSHAEHSVTKTAWRQGGDVTPPVRHWTLTVYISRPICNLTMPTTEAWQYIRGSINNNNDRVIKDSGRAFVFFFFSWHRQQQSGVSMAG